MPAVSVIIPSHNRRQSLLRMLGALSTQTFPVKDMEVIVAADACSDDTAHAVRSYQAPYSLRLFEGDWGAAGAARNAGASNACGRVIVFLDDDMEPAHACVAAHVHAHELQSERVTLGPSLPAIRGRVDFFQVELRAWWLDFFGAMAESGYRHSFRSFAAGNCAMPRTLFNHLGGFDETIGGCGGEDWELGVRMMKADIPFAFVAAASTTHFDNTDLDRSLRRRRQEGRSEVLIGARHPEVLPALGLMQLDSPPGVSSTGGLRKLAFTAPRLGDRLVGLLRRQADLAEGLRLRLRWRALFGRMRDYWYWRGVADELGSMRAAHELVRPSRVRFAARKEFNLDLSIGLRAAETRLDERRPAAVNVWYGEQRIGRIPAVAGAEPLRGVHLRQALATDMAERLLQVVAVQTAAAGSILARDAWVPIRPAQAESHAA